jgi:hypothetical protein
MATKRRRTKAQMLAVLKEQDSRHQNRQEITKAKIAVLEAAEKLNNLRTRGR